MYINSAGDVTAGAADSSITPALKAIIYLIIEQLLAILIPIYTENRQQQQQQQQIIICTFSSATCGSTLQLDPRAITNPHGQYLSQCAYKAPAP
jgi:hypothetical protein